ncbi:hypothetical protein ACFRI7_31670 [Streptomyces sp. NPDC056716]|uniref:hypothetical protein n=1 Tax=unclassified Streptomyces TaxID=2593676 RepID=UPI003695DADE
MADVFVHAVVRIHEAAAEIWPGVPVVSLLRGARGPWPTMLEQQERYVRRHDGLLQREAARIKLRDAYQAVRGIPTRPLPSGRNP